MVQPKECAHQSSVLCCDVQSDKRHNENGRCLFIMLRRAPAWPQHIAIPHVRLQHTRNNYTAVRLLERLEDGQQHPRNLAAKQAAETFTDMSARPRHIPFQPRHQQTPFRTHSESSRVQCVDKLVSLGAILFHNLVPRVEPPALVVQAV